MSSVILRPLVSPPRQQAQATQAANRQRNIESASDPIGRESLRGRSDYLDRLLDNLDVEGRRKEMLDKRKCDRPGYTPPSRPAWTTAELELLLDHIARLNGVARRTVTPARDYWRAFVLTACYSGLKVGNVLGIYRSDIADSGLLGLRMRSGERFVCALPPLVVECLRDLPGDPLVFGPTVNPRERGSHFDLIAREIGLVGGASTLAHCAEAARRLPVSKGGVQR